MTNDLIDCLNACAKETEGWEEEARAKAFKSVIAEAFLSDEYDWTGFCNYLEDYYPELLPVADKMKDLLVFS